MPGGPMLSAGSVGDVRYLRGMQGVKCRTRRAPIATQAEAATIAAGVLKGASAMRCPYCGWWHVVGHGSPIERPSKPRKRGR